MCFALGTLCQQPLAAVCHKGNGCTHSYGGPARTRIPRCLQPTVFGARQHRFALRRLWFDLWRQYVSSRPDPSSKIVKPGRVTTALRPQCWQRPGKTRVQFRVGAHANTCSGWYRVPDNISVVSAGMPQSVSRIVEIATYQQPIPERGQIGNTITAKGLFSTCTQAWLATGCTGGTKHTCNTRQRLLVVVLPAEARKQRTTQARSRPRLATHTSGTKRAWSGSARHEQSHRAVRTGYGAGFYRVVELQHFRE